MLPAMVYISNTKNEGNMTAQNKNASRLSIEINTAEAGCGSHCRAKKVAERIWEAFLGSVSGNIGNFGSPLGGAAQIPFGGRIIGTPIPCTCNGKTAFIIAPIAGPPGPYVVSWYGTGLKSFYSLWPGNQVVGGSNAPSSCSIPSNSPNS